MFIAPSRGTFALRQGQEGHMLVSSRTQFDLALLAEGASPCTPVSIAPMAINIALLAEGVPLYFRRWDSATIHWRNLDTVR